MDSGQEEGAKAIGMTHVQTMVYVILPQALRNIMPQIGNNLIINIKDTCVLSIISIVELFFATKGVAGTYYTYFEAFTITMVIYFILTRLGVRLRRPHAPHRLLHQGRGGHRLARVIEIGRASCRERV